MPSCQILALLNKPIMDLINALAAVKLDISDTMQLRLLLTQQRYAAVKKNFRFATDFANPDICECQFLSSHDRTFASIGSEH